MRRYRGTESVEPGIYFNARQLSFKSMEGDEPLPGTETDEYRRVPVIVLLFAGPLLGGLYVLFLPFIGFAMLAWTAAGKLVELSADVALAAARVLKPAWEPARAFLSRGRAAKKTRKRSDRWASDVREKLDEERHEPD
jgi:hypothetical protein